MKRSFFVTLSLETVILAYKLRAGLSFIFVPSRLPPNTLARNIPKVSTSLRGLSFPSSIDDIGREEMNRQMTPLESKIRKITMMTYIASMCIALPLTLSPIALLHNVGAIDDHTRQKLALDVGQMCARLLLKMMPFYDLQVTSDVDIADENPEPRIWVSNHVSMLDTFVLLASDLQLRGPNKRPIKVIYWKGLESNPVTNLMFTLCGFIPVDMAANAAGAPNEYDIGSFKTLLRKAKKAFEDGFDILVLPEGQLNPWPENGLLDIFPGAYKLSLMSKRKIQLVAMHGTHRFWHADESIGMTVTGKEVKMRAYSPGRSYKSAEDFMETFRNVVGHFGKHGEDLPENELRNWLSGGAWRSNDTSVISANSQMCTDDVEKEILSVLQRENSDEKAFNTLAEANECRQPIGVYTKKSPLIIHELVSSQVPLTA